jgi:proline dehydrogenase
MSPLRLSSTTGLLRSTLRSRPVRSLHSSSSSSSSTLRRRILVGSLLAAGTGTLLAYPGNKAHADEGGILPLSSASSLANKTEETTLSRTPLSSLLRTYLVYSFTSLPFIVDYSPQILSALTKSNIPGISGLTEWIVRKTFFDQFVGGDDSKSCIPVMETLRAEEIGVMLVYSVEVEEEHDPAHLPKDETLAMKEAAEARVRETLNCIKVAGDFERRMKARTGGLGFGGTWVAIKLVSFKSFPPAVLDIV